MTNDPASKKEPDTFHQHYAGTRIAKRQVDQHESMHSDQKPDKPEREPTPMEVVTRWFSFIRDPHNASAVTAVVTVLIFATTVAYTAFARRQWRAMIDSNAINHDALVSVQRAFVSYGGTGARRFVKRLPGRTQHIWIFEEHFDNNGSTPAIEVMHQFFAEEMPPARLTEEKFIGQEWPLGKSVIGPKRPLTVGSIFKDDSFVFGSQSSQLNAPEKLRTTEVTRDVFFWGWVIYRDVFPATRPHLTEYCQELSGIAADIKVPDPTYELHFVDCAQHNCTDQYCEDYDELVNKVLK